MFRKHLFLEHLCTMTFISSIEKDFIATTPDSFKNGCSVRHMFYTIFLYLWPKFLKNTFEVVHTYYMSFSGKIHIHVENLLNSYFYFSSFI